MKLVAFLDLARQPQTTLVRLPGGELLLPTFGQDGSFLEAYDPDLTPIWSVRLDARPIEILVAQDGTPWVLDRSGASAFGTREARLARVAGQIPQTMKVSAFAQVGGDFVFASDHQVHEPITPPVIQRVGNDGKVRWSTALPIGPIAYQGVVEMRADEAWKPRPVAAWTPRTWLSTSRKLVVSGDAVLATFSEMPRSGIGLGYVLSLADGAIRFTTRIGPIADTAALGDGAFLVGYQGYGAFETLRYERDGRVLACWATHGHYLVAGNDVRVIELENMLPSRMHLARLLPGGEVTRGAWLDGYATSQPCLRADGTALFFRSGMIFAARDLSIDDRLQICAAGDKVTSTPIVAGEESAYFAFWFWRKTAVDTPPRLLRVDS